MQSSLALGNATVKMQLSAGTSDALAVDVFGWAFGFGGLSTLVSLTVDELEMVRPFVQLSSLLSFGRSVSHSICLGMFFKLGVGLLLCTTFSISSSGGNGISYGFTWTTGRSSFSSINISRYCGTAVLVDFGTEYVSDVAIIGAFTYFTTSAFRINRMKKSRVNKRCYE